MSNEEKLLELLNHPRYRFRSIHTLTRGIGLNRARTEELLAELGARPSRRNPNLFGLVDRVGERECI